MENISKIKEYLEDGLPQRRYSKKVCNQFTEVKGNVPIARRYSIHQLKMMFKRYKRVEYYIKPNRENLGNKFYKLNRLFCNIMNKLFDGGLVTIKAIK